MNYSEFSNLRKVLGVCPEFIASWSQVPVPTWDLLLACEVGTNLWDNVRIELNCRTHSTGQDTMYLVSEASWEKNSLPATKACSKGRGEV